MQKNPEYVIKSDLKDKMLYCPNEFVHDCRLDSIKDGLNKKERELLRKDGGYQSQFWHHGQKHDSKSPV